MINIARTQRRGEDDRCGVAGDGRRQGYAGERRLDIAGIQEGSEDTVLSGFSSEAFIVRSFGGGID
jgi:hypothetical protein